MMKKTIAGIIITLIMVTAYVSTIPVQAQRPTIKVGVIGPIGMPQWSPAGMKEGAELARDEINVEGVDVGGTLHDFELAFGNEYSIPLPDAHMAQIEIERLITVEEVKFIVGGFNNPVTGAMIETAMDYGVPFIINGAFNDFLISDTVGVDYARYKYLFRIMPSNETALLMSLAAFIRDYLIPLELFPYYGEYLWPEAPNPQVRVAVLTEHLEWTQVIHEYLTNPAIYPMVWDLMPTLLTQIDCLSKL